MLERAAVCMKTHNPTPDASMRKRAGPVSHPSCCSKRGRPTKLQLVSFATGLVGQWDLPEGFPSAEERVQGLNSMRVAGPNPRRWVAGMGFQCAFRPKGFPATAPFVQ